MSGIQFVRPISTDPDRRRPSDVGQECLSWLFAIVYLCVPSNLDMHLSFTYIRRLRHRKAIEEQTVRWDKTIVDRREELSSWVDSCYRLLKRGILPCAHANKSLYFAGLGPRRAASATATYFS